MSFGPRKPATGAPRATRPALIKKPVSKAPVTRSDAKAAQQTAKPKAAPKVVPPGKKTTPVAPKKSVPKPPSPEPVYDYESDFESDESVPSADSSSSSEEPVDHTESESSTSEGGGDENDDNDDDDVEESGAETRTEEHWKPTYSANRENTVGESPSQTEVGKLEQQPRKPNARNARSVDILSKISLNDVTADLYKFDPEEYAELRTTFGVTVTVAHGKHIQTDSSLVSTAQQTSRVVTRDRYTSMHGGLRGLQVDSNEEDSLFDQGNDEEELQNYSSLQNIERMFTTLNGTLERKLVKDSFASLHEMKTGGRRRIVNQQRGILQLVRQSAPIFEALLEAKRLKSSKTEVASVGTDGRPDELPDDRRVSKNVIRSFDTGKMCPEFEVKLLHAKQLDQEQPSNDRFVIEFWARGTYSRPMYRFSSWSAVKCVDYECRRQMMVFGGTSDGTLQMWLGEASRCHSEILAPHQITAPNVGRKHKLACWEIVTVKVLPVSATKDSTIDTGNENVLHQVFGLFSSGIVVVWHVQMDARDPSATNNALNARLGRTDVLLVQSKVIDLSTRIGSRLSYDALRSFGNLLLHDHHQMMLSTDRSVIRLSHFVESEYDPALLIQPDPAHSIVNLKRMAQTTDTLFALYSNKTVRVLKLNTAPDGADSARHRHRKHDNQPNLMLSVCTNKSCTIQSIVHEEAKRYSNSNSASGGRADGGTVAPRANELESHDSVMLQRPRFHHGQQILFFGNCHPDSLLGEQNFSEKSLVFQRAT